MTQEFEYSEFDREKLKYNFSNLTPEECVEKQKMFEDYQIAKKKEQEEKKKAEAEAKRLAEELKANEDANPKIEENLPSTNQSNEIVESSEEPKVLTPEEEEKQRLKEERRRENERKRAERLAAAKDKSE
jgi:colicin import membrane protein